MAFWGCNVKTIGYICLVLVFVALFGFIGWTIGNNDVASYHLRISALQSEIEVCESNYKQVTNALNEQNISTTTLPIDDQIANALGTLVDDEGNSRFDFTLSYHIIDGNEYGDISITISKGDKVFFEVE